MRKQWVWRTEEQKRELVNKADEWIKQGGKMSQFTRDNGLHPTAIYVWRKKYTEKPPEVREVQDKSASKFEQLKQHKAENDRLRYIVADLMLDRQALLEKLGRV